MGESCASEQRDLGEVTTAFHMGRVGLRPVDLDALTKGLPHVQ